MQLGDHQALCFLLLDGADVQQKTSKGKSASDLAQAANQQGSHNQVISMLTLRAMPSWEDRLLEQWIGCRWVGGQDAEIDASLVSECAEGTEGGKVTDLNFHYKFLRCIEGLESSAPQLRSLDLSSNNIRVMENLGAMPKLRELKLDSCQISRISGLEKCPSLVKLHLEDNEISSIEGLEKLFSLEVLNLERNKLSRLGRGLMKLSKLKELRIALNELTSLEGLQGLGALEVLDASRNQLETLSIEQLKGAPCTGQARFRALEAPTCLRLAYEGT
eukprot:g10774.t1